MKYIINMICAIYMINNKSVSKTIGNKYIIYNASSAVIAQLIRLHELWKKARS